MSVLKARGAFLHSIDEGGLVVVRDPGLALDASREMSG